MIWTRKLTACRNGLASNMTLPNIIRRTEPEFEQVLLLSGIYTMK